MPIKALRNLLTGMLAFALMCACGTQDYPTKPASDTGLKQMEVPTVHLKQPALTSDESIPKGDGTQPGYFWQGLKWFGVADKSVAAVKCRLMDRPGMNHFKAFGTSLFGGAVLGLVIRGSGSWFFGAPVDSEAGHWFWHNLEKGVKNAGQGLARGAVFGGACQMLLAGGSLSPIDGILGQDFAALSSAVAIGAMASIAAPKVLSKLLGQDWINSESPIGKLMDKRTATHRGIDLIRQWTNTSDLAKGVVYRVVPGVLIVGIGSGIGLVMYDWLQDHKQDCASSDDPNRERSNYACSEFCNQR